MPSFYSSISEFLSRDDRRTVHFCVSNSGNSLMARNLAISARLSGVPLIYFALDVKSVGEMMSFCDVVDVACVSWSLGFCGARKESSVDFGTPDFAAVAWQRYEIMKTLLEAGRNVVYLDTDVVVIKNYENEVLRLLEVDSCDILIQSNHMDYPCTGFMVVPARSHPLIASIFSSENVAAHGYGMGYKVIGDAGDQSFFHEAVYPGSANSGSRADVRLLSKDCYPNGQWFYDRHGEIDNLCQIIHFNCIIGQEAKINQMIKYGKWFVD